MSLEELDISMRPPDDEVTADFRQKVSLKEGPGRLFGVSVWGSTFRWSLASFSA